MRAYWISGHGVALLPLILHDGAWSRIGRVVKRPPNISVKVKVKNVFLAGSFKLLVTTSWTSPAEFSPQSLVGSSPKGQMRELQSYPVYPRSHLQVWVRAWSHIWSLGQLNELYCVLMSMLLRQRP